MSITRKQLDLIICKRYIAYAKDHPYPDTIEQYNKANRQDIADLYNYQFTETEAKPRNYETMRKILSEGGTNFDYLFDSLQALEVAVKSGDSAYLQEKINQLTKATSYITHDITVWAERVNRKKESEDPDLENFPSSLDDQVHSQPDDN